LGFDTTCPSYRSQVHRRRRMTRLAAVAVIRVPSGASGGASA